MKIILGKREHCVLKADVLEEGKLGHDMNEFDKDHSSGSENLQSCYWVFLVWSG